MGLLGRVLRFVLLIALLVWFGYEIVRFPIRIELKAVIVIGLLLILRIAVGELHGIIRRP